MRIHHTRSRPRLPLAHRGRRPRFFPAPGTDELVSMVLELTSELWVLKKRLHTLEQVADRKGGSLAERIEAYEPSADEAAELDRRQQELIRTVLRSLETDPAERRRVQQEMVALGVAEGTAQPA